MLPHVENLIAFYALGALTPDEVSTVEAHLAECAACRALAGEASQAVEQLAFAAAPVQPSAGLKERLFDRVRADASHRARMRVAAATLDRIGKIFSPAFALAGVVVALALGAWAVSLQAQVLRLMAELQEQRETLSLIAMPGAQTFPLTGTEFAPQASGALLTESSRSTAVLLVTGLPPLEVGREYQLWLIRGDQPIGSETFRVDEGGMGQLRVALPEPIAGFQAVGITDEPDGGSPAPTGHLVMSGALE